MSHGARPLLGVALLTAVIGSTLTAPAHAAGGSVRADRPLVVLTQDHAVRTRPSARAPVGGVRGGTPAAHRRPDRASRTRPLDGPRWSPWVRVRLPGRPSEHTGWIRARHTRRRSSEWRLVVTLSSRRVTVYRHGRVARRFSAIVGKSSTPTPTGNFFIEEALALSSQVGGPYALATSARSNVLQEFEGGPGQIAMHGVNGLSGALGSAASHGCIRLSTDAITWLAGRIGSGVPLTIRG